MIRVYGVFSLLLVFFLVFWLDCRLNLFIWCLLIFNYGWRGYGNRVLFENEKFGFFDFRLKVF